MDCKYASYWWDESPLADRSAVELPDRCDVLIVGAGYTGLCAAIELAAAGRHCVVVDAEQPGAGCSTRNGGQISSSIKPGYAALARRYGPELGSRIMNAGHESLFWIEDFIKQQNIDCAFQRCGRFYGAHTPGIHASLASRLQDQPPGVTLHADVVSRDEQHRYIDSDQYHGGIIYHDHCSLDPGRYHRGLLANAESNGVLVAANTRVLKLHRCGNGQPAASAAFTASTSRGDITANKVIIATNGYTDGLMPWVRRRVIPIGSYMIATDVLSEATVDRLIPSQRVITDSRKLVVYFRPSPDNTRILFGARVSITETDAARAVEPLRQQLAERFPELNSVGVSHAWMGFVAYTFGELPHYGERDGVHHALGYCGSGVSLSSFCGVHVARQILGTDASEAFAKNAFEQRFYYRSKPWFLAPSIAWYRFRDSYRS